jgi:hypothetical protein
MQLLTGAFITVLLLIAGLCGLAIWAANNPYKQNDDIDNFF